MSLQGRAPGMPIRTFMRLAALCLLPLMLNACMPAHIAKLNFIRTEKLPQIKRELAAAHLAPGAPLYIRIFKEEGILETWMRNKDTGLYQPYKAYQVCKWSGGLGPKLREGDKQAPEGFYAITREQLWPQSVYHLAMNVGYPNNYDFYHKRTGSKIMIHGDCVSEGCFAMTDPAIEEIYLLAEQSLGRSQDAVQVDIFPFRMTTENLQAHKTSQWLPFWLNLKEGYDYFERTRLPPVVTTMSGRYLFQSPVFL